MHLAERQKVSIGTDGTVGARTHGALEELVVVITRPPTGKRALEVTWSRGSPKCYRSADGATTLEMQEPSGGHGCGGGTPPSAKHSGGTENQMTDEALLKRITVNREIFGGKPIIRGMRISVEMILSLLAQGETYDAILDDYPDLEPEDILACIAYAHAAIANDSLAAVRVVNE